MERSALRQRACQRGNLGLEFKLRAELLLVSEHTAEYFMILYVSACHNISVMCGYIHNNFLCTAVDYVPVDQEIVVGKFNGLSSHCIIVSTVEDNVLEKTESFFLTITTPSKNIKAESTELSVSILDDDGKRPHIIMCLSSLSPT